MGWQDRDYPDHLHHGGNPFTNPLLKILFGSLPIGTWFRIRVRIHASLFWYVGLSMIFAGADWKVTATSCAILFITVLLHEFGHAFACRMVGGTADDILLWILGGLATCQPPRRPWPTFVTIAGGPLVNLIICVITGAMMFSKFHVLPPLNPLFTFFPSAADAYFSGLDTTLKVLSYVAMVHSTFGYYTLWVYLTSWTLFFFNLLPMYPLDGGQMLQSILWKPLGYSLSMRVCCYLGMGMAVLMAIVALFSSLFLMFLAAFAFITCYQQLRYHNMNLGEVETDGYDLSAAWDHPDRPLRKKSKKRWAKAARKKALAEQAEQAQIDAILAKVKEKGLHSLTWWEKRALKRATERQRQQDLAERL